jgi:transposase
MHRLQELVRLYRLGTGVRERARLLAMSTRTERAYRAALAAADLLEGPPDAVPELAVLRAAVEVAKPVPLARDAPSSVDRWLDEIHRQAKAGAGPQAIWDRLHRTKPEFTASVSAVKRAVRRWRREQPVKPEDVAIPVVTAPGEVAQVDFGFAGWFFDPDSGKVRKAWVFVMVMAFSRHLFAKLVFDQKASTWIQLHVEAFDWFGGVPETIVPDNLKAAVVRAAFGVGDRHELALNRSYRELAHYYGFKVDPTPVASPKKKGKVESAVKYVCRNFLVAGMFDTLVAANADLPSWLLATAGQRIHGTTGRRPLEAFATERPALRPLPATPYDPVIWKQATVHADSHVEFERRLYSVPWVHLGQQVWVKATRHSVLVYLNDERIATHQRRGADRHSTTPGHLPEHRADLAQRSLTYWTERADHLGEDVGTYVRHVIASDDTLSKLRDVQAIVTHLEQFPQVRAAAAARRADYYANYTYPGIRRILAHALDLEPLPRDGARHGQLTTPRFARRVSELLLPTMESTS